MNRNQIQSIIARLREQVRFAARLGEQVRFVTRLGEQVRFVALIALMAAGAAEARVRIQPADEAADCPDSQTVVVLHKKIEGNNIQVEGTERDTSGLQYISIRTFQSHAYVDKLFIQYKNGHTQIIDVDMPFPIHYKSDWIALPGDNARNIDRIYMLASDLDGVSVRSQRGTGITVYGCRVAPRPRDVIRPLPIPPVYPRQ
jgi:hypothetical protein